MHLITNSNLVIEAENYRGVRYLSQKGVSWVWHYTASGGEALFLGSVEYFVIIITHKP